jgi:hypothetical protein
MKAVGGKNQEEHGARIYSVGNGGKKMLNAPWSVVESRVCFGIVRRSNAPTISYHSSTGIVDLNLARCLVICPRFCVLWWSNIIHVVLPTVKEVKWTINLYTLNKMAEHEWIHRRIISFSLAFLQKHIPSLKTFGPCRCVNGGMKYWTGHQLSWGFRGFPQSPSLRLW